MHHGLWCYVSHETFSECWQLQPLLLCSVNNCVVEACNCVVFFRLKDNIKRFSKYILIYVVCLRFVTAFLFLYACQCTSFIFVTNNPRTIVCFLSQGQRSRSNKAACVQPTGAALHEWCLRKSYHPIWPPVVYVNVKCHFTAEIVRMWNSSSSFGDIILNILNFPQLKPVCFAMRRLIR